MDDTVTNTVKTLLGLGLFLFISPSLMAGSMFGFLKRETVHQCPEVTGVLTKDGVALANVKITRRLITFGKEKNDATRTDDQGSFSFPLVEIKKRNPNPFGMTQTLQDIRVEYEGEIYKLWEGSSPNIMEHRGITEKMSQLNCDIATKEVWIGFPNQEFSGGTHDVLTVCRWDMPGDFIQ